jgi:hypothetical protein
MNLNASAEIHKKSPRRSSKHERRHSDTPKSKPSATVKREYPKDIPLSITVLEEDSVNGLSLIGIEAELRGDVRRRSHRPSRRRHSTSPVRRSHRTEAPETPRRSRHSTDRKRSKSKRRRAKSSSRRASHITHEEKKSSHHRSRSKRRSSHHRRHEDSKETRPEGHADPTNQETEIETNQKKEIKTKEKKIETNEKKSQDPEPPHMAHDLDKSKDKKAEESTEDYVEVLREPIKIRRSISAPDLASPVKEAEPQDDDQEEAISPAVSSESMSRLHHSADSVTPRRGLWKRISKRSTITRPISSLSNEKSPRSFRSSHRLAASEASGGGSSKKSLSSSSSSSDLSYGGRSSSRGSCSDRSLTSPPPTIQPHPRGKQGMIVPKARKNYTPTVVHEAKQTLSYSERVMQGKIGISTILKPTPEGKTVEEF